MGKHKKRYHVKLPREWAPGDLTRVDDALQGASTRAIEGILAGETDVQAEWRLTSRICREFLSATEEPAQLALASGLGDWDRARRVGKAPSIDDPYTYWLWLAALAWKLLQCCEEQTEDPESVRQCAREGVIAIKSAPTLQRVVAQQTTSGASKVEERERGPQLKKPGGKEPVKLKLVD